MILNLFSPQTSIGLDIQSDMLHLVQLQKRKGRVCTKQMLFQALPANLVVAGKIIEWQTLTTILHDMVIEQQLQGCEVVVQIPASLLRMRILYLKKELTQSALHQEIIREINKDLLGIDEPLTFDYAAFNELYSDYKMVIYAVIRKSYLDQYIACINGAGLKLKIIDIDIYALARLVFGFVERSTIRPQIASKTDLIYACFIEKNKTYLIALYPSHVLVHYCWQQENMADMAQQLQAKLQNCVCTFSNESSQLIIIATLDVQAYVANIAEIFNMPYTYVQKSQKLHYLQKYEVDLTNIDPAFYMAASLSLRGLYDRT